MGLNNKNILKKVLVISTLLVVSTQNKTIEMRSKATFEVVKGI